MEKYNNINYSKETAYARVINSPDDRQPLLDMFLGLNYISRNPENDSEDKQENAYKTFSI